jgi:hypothetical protein
VRRRRWPQSAPRALHACQRRCRRRRGARRPPLRPPGGRYIRYSPPSGLGGRPTRCAAAALRRRCDLRQRGKRGGVSCRRRGRQGRAARRRLQQHPAVQRPCTRPHARIRGVFRARRAPRANGRGGRRRGRQWRRQRRRRRPGRGPSGRRRRRAPRRTRRYLRARSELRRVSAARRDGVDGARIRALGARHTCWAAEKVAAATARWAEAAAHPPATHRPPLDRSHRMGTVEYDGPAQ